MTKAKPTRRRTSSSIMLPVLAQGEKYAGILLGDTGTPSAHLILLPSELESATWADAGTWAKQIKGELPTRQEHALLFANLKKQFRSAWYWSSEPLAGDESYAWCQTFDDGYQTNDPKSYKLRARAVRRVAI